MTPILLSVGTMIAVLILSKCDFLSFNVWRWRALAGDEVVGHHHVRDACVVAAAISVVGFSSFGWTLGSTAERMAKERAQTAVVGVLAPDLRREIPALGGCGDEIGGVQQGFLMGPPIDHREGRLGNDAGKRYSELGRC